MAEESHDHAYSGDYYGWKERYIRSHIWRKGRKYAVTESSADHDDHELAQTQIEEYLVFIFYLYGDLVLHMRDDWE